jgi:hypothetical protein
MKPAERSAREGKTCCRRHRERVPSVVPLSLFRIVPIVTIAARCLTERVRRLAPAQTCAAASSRSATGKQCMCVGRGSHERG